MKKYLLWLLALPIMSPLLSFANAQDYSFVDDWNGEYNPMSLDTDWGVFSNFSWTPNDSLGFGRLILNLNWNQVCSIYVNSTNSDMNEDSCNGLTLEAWYYILDGMGASFTSASFSINPASSWGSDSVFPELSVPSSFTSWLTSLVNNFWSTISEWIPVVILVTLWITAIFALFRVVRNYARRSFKW